MPNTVKGLAMGLPAPLRWPSHGSGPVPWGERCAFGSYLRRPGWKIPLESLVGHECTDELFQRLTRPAPPCLGRGTGRLQVTAQRPAQHRGGPSLVTDSSARGAGTPRPTSWVEGWPPTAGGASTRD
jgi:hypothetical protein